MKRTLLSMVVCLVASMLSLAVARGAGGGALAASPPPFPTYNHVFLVIDENHNANQIINNPAAPDINALARDYGLASGYTGVSDPSEPNYVAMLGGSDFGINSDDPYFWPGHTISAPNLLSQMEGSGLSWKGYFQDMPYAGYRGYCYPDKCNGIPDSDTEYVAKHNGIVNFANMQTPAELAKETPLPQLTTDLNSGSVPNLSYIVPDECHDMHGSPPWCVDSGKSGGVDDTWLVSQGDAFVGETVNQITSSSTWASGNNAIVVTFDEGNVASDKVPTVVVTNHGPRGVTDKTSYNHYSLLGSLQATFGLGCLQSSCGAKTMSPLFQVTGSTTIPALPAPFSPPPNGTNAISAMGAPTKGGAAALTCNGAWQVVASPSIGNFDNNLASVSGASANDVWAVGDYYAPSNSNVLQNMAEHWDGSTWSEYPLPNIGLNQNTLLGVSELPTGHAWAAGYYVDATYKQQTLIQHYDGTTWSVIPSPSPGTDQNILYSIAAFTDSDVWAVGASEDSSRVWHTLAEHWSGTSWTDVPTVDAGTNGNLLYSVTAVSSGSVYASGQKEGTGFPDQALVEHWNGTTWSTVTAPATTESVAGYAVTGNDSALSVAGIAENDSTPYTTAAIGGAPNSLSLQSTPNSGAGEQDLFGATTASDGSTWAAGWAVDPASLNHSSLIAHDVNGQWSIVASPNPGSGDNGFASIASVPGGGVWAVGVVSGNANNGTLIEHEC
ncbi:MAG: alkaline phosphatase family protein [Candidatus Dormibacteria bacterium]